MTPVNCHRSTRKCLELKSSLLWTLNFKYKVNFQDSTFTFKTPGYIHISISLGKCDYHFRYFSYGNVFQLLASSNVNEVIKTILDFFINKIAF